MFYAYALREGHGKNNWSFYTGTQNGSKLDILMMGFLSHASEVGICPIHNYICIGSHQCLSIKFFYGYAERWRPFTAHCVYCYLDTYFHCVAIICMYPTLSNTMWGYPNKVINVTNMIQLQPPAGTRWYVNIIMDHSKTPSAEQEKRSRIYA